MERVQELIIDAYGCKGTLNDAAELEAALVRGAERVGATILSRVRQLYQPHGITAVLVLAESHILISTWPEHRFAVLEIFLCNDQMRPDDVAEEVFQLIRPAQTRAHRLTHQIGPQPEPSELSPVSESTAT